MNKFVQLRSRGVAVKTAIAASSIAFAAGANAALPEWATGMGATLTTAVEDSAAAVGPVVVASLVAVIIIKLIKRFANKI